MIKLGNKVQDTITGFEGIAIARVEFLTGCVRFCVEPKMGADGKLVDSNYFDEDRLRVTGDGIVVAIKNPAGPHPAPTRACDPSD